MANGTDELEFIERLRLEIERERSREEHGEDLPDGITVEILMAQGIFILPPPSPDDVVRENERKRAVARALSLLPVAQVHVIYMYFFLGRPLTEIGAEIGRDARRLKKIALQTLRSSPETVGLRAHC